MTRFFYRRGKKQELVPSEETVAIDPLAAATTDGVDRMALAGRGWVLPGGVVLVDLPDLDQASQDWLHRSGAARPVYRSGSGLVVLLPEVRVVLESGSRTRLDEAIAAAPHPVDVADAGRGTFVIRPVSGNSEDALDLANYFHEALRPVAASVRMLQVRPRHQPPP